MKSLLLILISLPVYSNTFELPETGARFTLRISPKELTYHSEGLNKVMAIKPCNLPLAKELNAELLSKLPKKEAKSGIKFIVDGQGLVLGEKDELTKLVAMMDARILRFTLEEKEACK